MSSVLSDIREQVVTMASESGKAWLNMRYGRDFEYYFVALELADGQTDEIIDYMSFPITPSSMIKEEPSQVNLDKTYGGIIVHKTKDFRPQKIKIAGTFGREIKTLAVEEMIPFLGVAKNGEDEVYPDKQYYTKKEFSHTLKTGYGCTKYLQRIVERSKQYSSGDKKIFRNLFFHNYIFGETYLVEVNRLVFKQDVETNAVWHYELDMHILAITDRRIDNSNTSLVKQIGRIVLPKVANLIVKQAYDKLGAVKTTVSRVKELAKGATNNFIKSKKVLNTAKNTVSKAVNSVNKVKNFLGL